MTSPAARPRGDLTLPVVGTGAVHILGGTVGLFIAFLFAYGFADRVTVGMHLFFLAASVVVAAATTLLAALTLLTVTSSFRHALALAASTALVLYPLAIAAGTVVSLLNEDQGSVTADQPDWPFVLLVVVGLALSGIALRRTAEAVRRG